VSQVRILFLLNVIGGDLVGLFSRRKADGVGLCELCGVVTSELDRRGRYAHAVCVERVVATVAAESRPSRDSRDVTQRLLEHQERVTAAVADLAVAAVELGFAAQGLPPADVRAVLAARAQDRAGGRQ
jgi:hypothetical protein